MNILGIVFSMLLIFSFGFYACLEKQVSIHQIHKTFLAQAKIHHQILSDCEEKTYKSIKAIRKNKPSKSKSSSKTSEKSPEKKLKIPLVNPECARLNLWPLLQQEKKEEEHKLLYEQLAQMLKIYYEKHLFAFFSDRSELQDRFLDAWLLEIRKILTEKPQEPVLLEKIAFKDSSLQTLYYNMLRGSKNKYPPLLDFVKIKQVTKDSEKLCLLHATPTMLSVFFTHAATAIYEEMHKETLAVTQERIEELCRQHHATTPPKELFALLSLSRFSHPSTPETTLWKEDEETKLSIRQKIYNLQAPLKL
ncbi:MAG: hypothetical protein Q8L98_05480 [Chlamydiales bacterium]|nr:hypothetical protein [Chlamydiales bacterium]